MPKAVHDRAKHIQAKNPSMPESEAWAIATKQLSKKAGLFHALVPTVAKDQDNRMRQIIREELQAANPHQDHSQQPSLKHKIANVLGAPFSLCLIEGFSDELQKIKIANLSLSNTATLPSVSSSVTSRMPRNTMSAKTPSYSQVQPASTPSPNSQPVLSSPPVRG